MCVLVARNSSDLSPLLGTLECQRDPVYRISGLVTMEDVLEEVMQREIEDEHEGTGTTVCGYYFV